jgi:ABC-type uncharacterized transport system involved in gliding motility auxiliary subunit
MNRILSLLSYVGMALVFGALAVRIYGKPEWSQYAIYASWAGLALVLLYTVGQWREIVAFFRRRNARLGVIASISALVGLGILVAVNYLSAQQNKRWDLTANKQYSLSDQSIRLLRGLKEPVKFIVFDKTENIGAFKPRLDEYQYQSKQVQVEYIDPDKKPVPAKEYEIQQYGTVVVEYMGRRERVTASAEQDLTGALVKVLNPKERRIYFLSGHGEKDPTNTERAGYSSIIDALRRDNYQWEKLVLAQTNMIPDNATVVVIAGPKTDLLEGEVSLLREYLQKRAGKLLLMLDPPEPGGNQMPLVTGLLREWGIEPGNNVVIDASGMGRLFGADASVPVAASYPPHAITTGFELLTAFPLARSMSPAEKPAEGRSPQTIIETSPRSWAESDLAPKGQVEMNPDKGDKQGPVSIGVAVSVAAQPATPDKKEGDAERPETRLVAIGDSDFPTNAALGVQGNADLFMNTVAWLSQQENLIAIRPKEAADRRLTMTADQMKVVTWLSLLIVPALVLGAGVFTWWRRRER